MSESTYEVNLRSPHTVTIDLAIFYNSMRLDFGKRICLFDGGLVAYVETTVNYANNPANRNAANELSLRPVLLRPTIAVGATAATITLHNLRITDYQFLAASILILSNKIYNGVSPATKTIMDDHAIDHPSFFHQLFCWLGCRRNLLWFLRKRQVHRRITRSFYQCLIAQNCRTRQG